MALSENIWFSNCTYDIEVLMKVTTFTTEDGFPREELDIIGNIYRDSVTQSYAVSVSGQELTGYPSKAEAKKELEQLIQWKEAELSQRW